MLTNGMSRKSYWQSVEIIGLQRLSVCRDYRFAEIIGLQKLSVCRDYQFVEITSPQRLPVGIENCLLADL